MPEIFYAVKIVANKSRVCWTTSSLHLMLSEVGFDKSLLNINLIIIIWSPIEKAHHIEKSHTIRTVSFLQLAACCLQPLGLTFGDGVPAGDTAHTVIEYNS